MTNSFLNFVQTFYIHPVYLLCHLKNEKKFTVSLVWLDVKFAISFQKCLMEYDWAPETVHKLRLIEAN
jgi:hypothetical protein